MKSTPASRCAATTSATASRSRSSATSGCAHTSSGAGSAPTWVVRILSVLRRMTTSRVQSPVDDERARAHILAAANSQRERNRLRQRNTAGDLALPVSVQSGPSPVTMRRRSPSRQRKERHRMAAPEVPSSHKYLLDAPTLTLATIDPHGRPQLSQIWFLAED